MAHIRTSLPLSESWEPTTPSSAASAPLVARMASKAYIYTYIYIYMYMHIYMHTYVYV